MSDVTLLFVCSRSIRADCVSFLRFVSVAWIPQEILLYISGRIGIICLDLFADGYELSLNVNVGVYIPAHI